MAKIRICVRLEIQKKILFKGLLFQIHPKKRIKNVRGLFWVGRCAEEKEWKENMQSITQGTTSQFHFFHFL